MSKRRKFSAEFKRGALEQANQRASVVPRWLVSWGSRLVSDKPEAIADQRQLIGMPTSGSMKSISHGPVDSTLHFDLLSTQIPHQSLGLLHQRLR
jgi:hypothetical protein